MKIVLCVLALILLSSCSVITTTGKMVGAGFVAATPYQAPIEHYNNK